MKRRRQNRERRRRASRRRILTPHHSTTTATIGRRPLLPPRPRSNPQNARPRMGGRRLDQREPVSARRQHDADGRSHMALSRSARLPSSDPARSMPGFERGVSSREQLAYDGGVHLDTAVAIGEHDQADSLHGPPDDEVLVTGVVAPLPDGLLLADLDTPPETPGQLLVDVCLLHKHPLLMRQAVL